MGVAPDVRACEAEQHSAPMEQPGRAGAGPGRAHEGELRRYWLVASDVGVFSFGAASAYGLNAGAKAENSHCRDLCGRAVGRARTGAVGGGLSHFGRWSLCDERFEGFLRPQRGNEPPTSLGRQRRGAKWEVSQVWASSSSHRRGLRSQAGHVSANSGPKSLWTWPGALATLPVGARQQPEPSLKKLL